MKNKKCNSLIFCEKIFWGFLALAIVIVCGDITNVRAADNISTNLIHSPVAQLVEKLEDIQDTKEKPMAEMPVSDKTGNSEKQTVRVCGVDTTKKSYEDGSMITDETSQQWALIQTMKPNKRGVYSTKDGYIGVALGSYYGAIGTKYEVTLSTGKILKVVKLDKKADQDTVNGCYHKTDGSMLEFVIDTKVATEYYRPSENGYVLNGNFNNHSDYSGEIVSMKRIID